MHIPSGFLEPQVWIPMTCISAAGVGYALKKSGDFVDERKTPVMGVMAAFIFAAQMVNFPVFSGTSGHLMGAALATAILGMWPAMVVMTSVVLVQALLFQDGGLDTLGANVFNMCILGCVLSGMIIGIGTKFGKRAFYPSVALASWLSVVGASAVCAVQLWLSGTSPIQVVLPAMVAVHAVIGAFEAFITIVSIKFIVSVNPKIIQIFSEIAENTEDVDNADNNENAELSEKVGE
ncbi:energy-coupling factor ABC transporter permease [Candidatus Latescibacterota bacterium]